MKNIYVVNEINRECEMAFSALSRLSRKYEECISSNAKLTKRENLYDLSGWAQIIVDFANRVEALKQVEELPE